MAMHTVDTQELKALANTLDDFASYLATFESQAMAHGNALLNVWAGQAAGDYIGELVTWAVGARLIQTRADGMAQWAHGAEASYVSAVESAKEVTGN